ncbi:chloride channel-like protein 3 [Amylocarpus encephaloides]|uniref:Chloride channel protein n=1 Tax=Amylocarpus encephaloides TaxID=45428 RepID=A0A9P8C5E0_9HELO|nr:chloride channel-like protein 3 [Amylocarpus encephaloides]
MPQDEEAHERSSLLDPHAGLVGRRGSRRVDELRAEDADSIISSHLSKDEQALGSTAIGERLPYNDYTTIDWLHDLIKDSYRYRALRSKRSIKYRFVAALDSCQGWFAAALIGVLTAIVAFAVDVSEATLSDYKLGYCSTNMFITREGCCASLGADGVVGEDCENWIWWSKSYGLKFTIYVGIALLYGLIAGGVTMTTKANLPAVAPQDSVDDHFSGGKTPVVGKGMYMAAGSGIPEIKTILSGFVIPHFLDFKVLLVKAIGSAFAVATGMCLGKEGPFVHISTSVGYLVANLFPKYRDNGRKMREMLSVACSSGLSVAFGAPIGGVLFSYEEISTYFPRKVLWRAFLCSLSAAVTLKALNPTGTGKLVLFETNYGVNYDPVHYLVFIFLGIAGGIFGGTFCQANFLWSKSFRKYSIIKNHPVLELCVVVLITALVQYPNPLTREPGDIIMKNVLIDCQHPEGSWICAQEALEDKSHYYGWLVYGTVVKLLLTIITFGCKVPSGIIVPALNAGALFGRLIGQAIPDISPGIFAMVGAAAFLAGVSRMTVSLAVIMFELTGEVDYIPPFMIAILVAKWVADAMNSESIYDLAQTVLGHPFLDPEHALKIVRNEGHLVDELIPPAQTMREITVDVGTECKVSKALLATKLSQLKARGLMDAGVVLVDGNGMLHGYLAEGELDFAIHEEGVLKDGEPVDLLQGPLSAFVDRTPLTICAKAPMEYAVQMFVGLGLRHLIVTEEGSGKVVGVIIKKRLVLYLEGLQH